MCWFWKDRKQTKLEKYSSLVRKAKKEEGITKKGVVGGSSIPVQSHITVDVNIQNII